MPIVTAMNAKNPNQEASIRPDRLEKAAAVWSYQAGDDQQQQAALSLAIAELLRDLNGGISYEAQTLRLASPAHTLTLTENALGVSNTNPGSVCVDLFD